jgi:AraC family transcriptional regulator
VILHLDGYVPVDRWIGGKHEGRMIAAGGTFIMPGGVDFRVRLGGSLSTVHFYLRHHVLVEVARDMLRGDPDGVELAPRFGDSDPLLERLILSVRDEMLDPDDMSGAYVDSLARSIAARLLRAPGPRDRLAPPPPDPGARDADRAFARAVDYLHAHLHRAVSLDELAASVDMSVTRLTALFKRIAHAPPHRFIMGLRVERARGLLAQGDLPLAEVALACGFSHQEHMTRMFKRATSLTPAVYRRGARG